MTIYRIICIGSLLRDAWAIERNGLLLQSDRIAEVLCACLDAIAAGASPYDAEDIANVIRARPRPSYGERFAVFSPSGRPEPSRDPFLKG